MAYLIENSAETNNHIIIPIDIEASVFGTVLLFY